jgi:predicted dehydrogenase
MKALRVAIAGTGMIGRVHARSALLAGGHLVGVAASTPERASEAATELGAGRAFPSADELVTAPDVDVVHICTPNHLHVPLAEAALAAGKHVICEKPLALDVAGARRLVQAAEKAGAIATVPFVYRYYPLVREARARVASGETGPIRLVHGAYLQDWLLRAEDDNWRVDAALGGQSRAFADIGSHWCDLVEFVTGHRIARLTAQRLTAIPERAMALDGRSFAATGTSSRQRRVTTEDAATVLFNSEQGAHGSLVVSQISPGRKNRLMFELAGADEAIAFDQEEPESMWIGRRSESLLLRRDPAHLTPAAARYATLPGGHPQGYHDCFDAFVADTYTAIRTGKVPDGLPLFADGLRAALITEAVLRSADDGGWQGVSDAESGRTEVTS